jgi:hypothetical protein
MNPVAPRGDKNSPLHLLGYKPSEEDEAKGTVFMDTSGWYLDQWLRDANLPVPYFNILQPMYSLEFPKDLCLQATVKLLNDKKPPLILTCDSRRAKGEKLNSDILELLIPETKGLLSKYQGSLLTSPYLTYPHYLIPVPAPSFVFENWSEKDLLVSIDLGKVKEELSFFEKNGFLQPLPERNLITEPSFAQLLDFLLYCVNTYESLLRSGKECGISVDIETIRPPKKKKYDIMNEEMRKHPGYPYTISLAPNPKYGISFSLWDYTENELLRIWRILDWLLRAVPQIGQNYFLFDCFFLEALGFRPCLTKCQDTRIRHHILWPELSHSLQFQTRQYSRQPYYKDEGKGWSPKYKKQLMKYNALDTTVTWDVFLGQEAEFEDRPHLR